MVIYMYIAPGWGQTYPLGPFFQNYKYWRCLKSVDDDNDGDGAGYTIINFQLPVQNLASKGSVTMYF